jgi:hypothetical protein
LAGNHAVIPTRKIKKPSVALLGQWIKIWKHISPAVRTTGFKKCCMSNAINRTEHISWDEKEKYGNVGSERDSVSTKHEKNMGLVQTIKLRTKRNGDE